jgi:hypothetical protein
MANRPIAIPNQPLRRAELTTDAGELQHEVDQAEDEVAAHGDEDRALELGRDPHPAALVGEQRDPEHGQRPEHRLSDDAGPSLLEEPADAADEQAFHPGVREDQRRIRRLLERDDEAEDQPDDQAAKGQERAGEVEVERRRRQEHREHQAGLHDDVVHRHAAGLHSRRGRRAVHVL